MEVLSLMNAFLKMGDLASENESLTDQVKYKERIVFATMRKQIKGWKEPYDWHKLTDEVKMERLKAIEKLV